MMNEEYWLTCETDGVCWSARSDGRWAVIHRGGVPDGVEACQQQRYSMSTLLEDVLAAPLAPADRGLVAGLRVEPLKSCEVCNGGGILECDECEGQCQVECECTCGDAHEADCGACDGQGKVDCECVPQGPQGKAVPARIAGLHGTWDRRILTKLLDALPQAPDAFPLNFGTGKNEMLIVESQGVYAVLMPVHATEPPPLHAIGIAPEPQP